MITGAADFEGLALRMDALDNMVRIEAATYIQRRAY